MRQLPAALVVPAAIGADPGTAVQLAVLKDPTPILMKRDIRRVSLPAGMLMSALGMQSLLWPAAEAAPWHDELSWGERQVTVTSENLEQGRRRYRFALNEAGQAVRERVLEERAGQSRLRTGNTLFDGLYALALDDARLDSVTQIQDAAFNGGQPIACLCFETGEKWHYVWTRDIAYAIDLGLAWFDPERARNSLLFKQSGVRPEMLSEGVAPVQVVAQDTGSGGSWPISTDRVVWIHAAVDTLRQLPAPAARAFAALVWPVAHDTLEQDRQYAFDPLVGLYRGETSFLDWREQTYPQWTRADTLYIAESYSLSTNVLHYVALRDAAELARRRHAAGAAQFQSQARALRAAINTHFWQADAGSYASYLGSGSGSGLKPVPAAAYDLLGLALAIIHGVADEGQAQLILKNYAITAAGPPVIWPEQQNVAIYHNRALWPFVTAYALQAAKRAQHAELFARDAESLLRGAALSLSNMENFEFLTQQSHFEDGSLSGPVINSPRQLWSVGAFLNMVVSGLFGLDSEAGGVRVSPYLPGRLAHELFAGQSEISLHGGRYPGGTVNLILKLPARWSDDETLQAASPQTLRGSPAQSQGTRTLVIALVGKAVPRRRLTVLEVRDPHALTSAERRAVYAPRQPQLAPNESEPPDFSELEANSVLQIFRNGKPLGAEGDVARSAAQPGARCYFATQRYGDSGLVSLPSRELCRADADTQQFLAADGTLEATDHHPVSALGGRAEYADWGGPAQELRLSFTARTAGLEQLRVEYANAQGPINTGITAAVKMVQADCGGAPQQQGAVVMPHLSDWRTYGGSSRFVFTAARGQHCTIRLRDGFNMSYLEHFRRYTAGRGGATGAVNRASISAVRIERIE